MRLSTARPLPPFVLGALLALGIGHAAAQGLDPGKALTQYGLDTWTTDDDLPQNSVTALLQTRDGYLWLGTYGGLARFDGVRFVVYDSGNTESLHNNGIQALCERRDGSLWIGTNGGGLTQYHDGEFSSYGTLDGLPSDIVRVLYEDRRGTLWIGTNDGLSALRDGRFTTYGTKEGLSNGVVRAIAEDEDGALWIGTNGGGLDRLENGRFTHLTVKDGLPSDFVFALLKARDGALWIGTNGGGLARHRAGRIETFTTRDGLADNIVWSLSEDALGTVWIGTYGGGVARFRDGRFSTLSTRDGLSNDFVRSLLPDREGSLWIGTYSGGLSRLRDGKFTTFSSREGLSHDWARAVFEDSKGNLWVGTTGGGACRMKAGVFRCFGTADGFVGDREGHASDVRAFHEDESGALWIGTGGAGLFRYADGQFRRYSTRDGLSNDNVNSLSPDGRGGLWVGTYGGGLAHLSGGKWTVTRVAEGRAGNFVLTTLVDRRGAIWAGTDGGGLARLEGGQLTSYRRTDGLASDIVFTLHEDTLGTLWIGTSGGLSCYRDGRFRSFTPREGLLDEVVFRILEDAEGHFWLSGNKGVSRVARQELEALARGEIRAVAPTGYGTADGMKSNECSGLANPAGWKARDGRLWFPTARGIVVIDPSRIAPSPVAPLVKIERVVVDGEPLASFDVPPGKRRWDFEYTAPSFLAPRRVRFKYRLDPYDADWVEAGTQRTAHYTRLPPGTYTFRVLATSPEGVLNETGDALTVTLRPFFWQTGWFLGTAALGLGVLGALAYNVRVSSLRAHRRELEAQVEERTRDLVAETARSEAARAEAERARAEAERQKEIAQEADRFKSEILGIAAHDLKTPLQSIIGYGDLMAQEPSTASEYAGYTGQAARRMLDIINRLLESDAVEKGRLPVVPDTVDVGRLAFAMAATLQPQADAKFQRIRSTVEEGCLVEGDEAWLRQVLENLLGNAIKYSPQKRAVYLTVRREGDKVLIEVRDEGPGLTETDKSKLFGKFQRLSARPTGGESSTGLGLSIVKQLVELHFGRAWAESDGPGTGSRFVVELPAK
jgi:ligand-binding sensor domain-containing protein/signal transduction histidine kinase